MAYFVSNLPYFVYMCGRDSKELVATFAVLSYAEDYVKFMRSVFPDYFVFTIEKR